MLRSNQLQRITNDDFNFTNNISVYDIASLVDFNHYYTIRSVGSIINAMAKVYALYASMPFTCNFNWLRTWTRTNVPHHCRGRWFFCCCWFQWINLTNSKHSNQLIHSNCDKRTTDHNTLHFPLKMWKFFIKE